MDVFLVTIAVIMGVIGLLGCVLPALPGPPLSYLGLVIMYFWHNNPASNELGNEITERFMLIWLAITIIVTVLDYVVPVFFTKLTGGSREAVRGSIAGTIVGMFFFPPFGIIVGAFLGALLGELIINRKDLGESILSATGSFIGFVFGTGIKLIASGIMLFYIISFI